MRTWDPTDLDALGAASTIRSATTRADGTLRQQLPIWVVRVGNAPYVRSYHGPDGSWFRHVTTVPRARLSASGRSADVRVSAAEDDRRIEVDRAYWAKYGRGGFGAAMTTNDAVATTVRLDPDDAACLSLTTDEGEARCMYARSARALRSLPSASASWACPRATAPTLGPART